MNELVFLLPSEITPPLRGHHQRLLVDNFNRVLNRLLCSGHGMRLVDSNGTLPMLLNTSKYKEEGESLLEVCGSVASLKLMSRNAILSSIRSKFLSERTITQILPKSLFKFVVEPLVTFKPWC